jgi:guanylate kinase
VSGNLFIVCAPSGAGKTSLVGELVKADPGVRISISYTTRSPRPSEVDGRDYHFVSMAEFEAMQGRGEFIESALVHGNRYGTGRQWIAEQRATGSDIVLEIDWQGAAQIRAQIPDAIGIFLLPPSLDALMRRLNQRGEDGADVISRRLAAARTEIGHVGEFNYVIINDDFAEAARDLISIVRAQRLAGPQQIARHHDLINKMR